MDQAQDYLRRALDIRRDAEIAAHLGEVLWSSGEQEAARALWDEALEQDRDNRTLLETIRRLDPQ